MSAESPFIEITNKDIYQKLLDHECIQTRILEQATKTNGRVTNLENKSLGIWISSHPFRFAGLVIVFFGGIFFTANNPQDLLDIIKSLL